MKVLTFALAIVCSLSTSGCWLGRKKAITVLPPPPQPALAKPAPVIAPSTDVVIPPAEAPPAPAPVIKLPEPPKEKAPEPQPEVKTPPARKRRPPPRQITEVPKPAEPDASASPGVTGTVPAGPSPQLREILTPERRRQYETEYASSVLRAKSALNRVSGRNLTPPQQEMLNRIRTFVGQAEESRNDDLGTAWQLARRADLLGQDLLESLR